MEWPIYFKDQLVVGNPKQAVGICALWTLKELVVNHLNKDDFSVCGQLYSKEGVKYIIRNILANPYISFLIICGQDKSKSGDALLAAFHNDNFFDKNIPQDALEKMRSNVKLIDMRGDIDIISIQKILDSLKNQSLKWAEPQIFEDKTTAEKIIFPTDPSSFRLKYGTVADAWPWVLKHISRFGLIKETDYGVREKEILNLSVVITDEDPQNIKFVDYFNFNKQEFENYALQVLNAGIKNKSEDIGYTYGDRLRNFEGIDQIQQGIIEKLKKSIYSRRAIACVWQTEKDLKSSQPPCLVLLQAIVQNNKLYLTAYFRSNDMFAAWPQNALALRRMQDLIAKEIDTGLGSLTTISSSAHIYEQDFESAERIIKDYTDQLKCEWDPRGNFVITIDKIKNEIIIQHYSPEGLKIGEYAGKNAVDLYNQLDKDLAVSQIGHAFYLGRELSKAEIALKQNLEYYQDKE